MNLREFVEGLRNGDPESRRIFLETYHGPLAIKFRVLPLQEQDREDLFQEVALRVLDGISGQADPDKFPAWFAAITRNEICSSLRKKRQRRRLQSVIVFPDLRPRLIQRKTA